MYRMKKWNALMIALMVFLAFGTSVYAGNSPRVGNLPQAGVGDEFETTIATVSTASLGSFNPGAIIYGFSVHPRAAGGTCGLYDVATLPGAQETQGIFIDEGGNDGSQETFQSNWPAPYRLVTDLTVVCSSANAIIYHSPQS